jgi:L-asparaginase II
LNRAVVEVRRGGEIESVHRVSIAVVERSGRLHAAAGHAGLVTFARSAVKPIQALPLVEDGVVDRFGLSDRELALCCASHNGEPHHVGVAAGLLQRLGLSEDALACGPHDPLYAPAARALRDAGQQPGRIHNNCSGKHAGMLALARAHGWPVEDYHTAPHPVQQRMLFEMSRWSGIAAEHIATAVDGCGVVTFALPLEAMARAFARFAGNAADGGPAARIVAAVAAWPEYLAGTGRLCTKLLRASAGRIVAKVGAEGVYCAAVPEAGLGVALKIEDGATRAAGPALLATLQDLDVLRPAERTELQDLAAPELRNTRGERVGELRAWIGLSRS